MKLDLRENMYIRTKDGYISQYKYYDTTNAYMKLYIIQLIEELKCESERINELEKMLYDYDNKE